MSGAVRPSGLAEAVCKVMEKVRNVPKDRRNTQQNYDYTSDAALTGALQPAMAEVGLMLAPIRCEQSQVNLGKTAKGDDKLRVDVVMTYRLLHAPTGESLDLQVVGSGYDSLDKGAYKAMTGALKYVLRQLFLIPTGDDPEEDRERDDRRDERQHREEPRRESHREEPRREEPPRDRPISADDFRRYWFARLAETEIKLTDDDRHKVQTKMLKVQSLNDLTDEQRAYHRRMLERVGKDRLIEIINTALEIPY